MRGRLLFVVAVVAFVAGIAVGAFWDGGLARAQAGEVMPAASAPGVDIEGGGSRNWEVVRISDSSIHCLMIKPLATLADPLFFECVPG